MQIQVNTDSKTQGSIDLHQVVQAHLLDKLGRFSARITRAEVHLNDENGPQKTRGNDKRCMIEIRMNGMDPISATDFSSSHEAALRGATNKIQNQIETIIGKLGHG